ncbi:glycosyltransferase [Roseomonas sp. AR75]|uniref:glycosyltransferase family 2 protein n=1 Tax=Roseomonas sp. AR75 TaxID=2562311 RepID=UPI0010C06FD1|nr:glycosyltransferase [Roseomonas sp. AR75]
MMLTGGSAIRYGIRMTMPAVSVLMPVRDGAAFLPAALDSILRQEWRDFDCIVVDDGSRDATPQLLAQAARRDARIRVLTQPRSGVVSALNRGLAASRAPWVARMDADDVARPDRLAKQMALAATTPQAVAIASGWRVVDAAGRVLREVTPPPGPQAIAAALPRGNPLAHPTMLLNRAAVLAVGGYRASYDGAEDYDLWLRLSEAGALHALTEALVDYRIHAGQATWQTLERSIVAAHRARRAAERRRAGRAEDDGLDGMSDALIAGALGAAKEQLALGQGRGARAALALLRAQPGLALRTRLHAHLLWLRSLLTPRG